jgi:hypothetical protein
MADPSSGEGYILALEYLAAPVKKCPKTERMRVCQKDIRGKRGRVAQAVEHLPSMCEFKPQSQPKKEKKKT